jgi:hypothetical protein
MLSRYVWNGQSRQELDCTGANLPSGQRSHRVLPSPTEYLPASQSRHRVALSSGEYLPASHGMHWRETSYVPAGQAVHANRDGAPLRKEYVPATHGWQSCADPLYRSSRNVWNGQSWQALELAGAYLPSTHVTQSCALSYAETVPFPQGTHARAPGVFAGKE